MIKLDTIGRRKLESQTLSNDSILFKIRRFLVLRIFEISKAKEESRKTFGNR